MGQFVGLVPNRYPKDALIAVDTELFWHWGTIILAGFRQIRLLLLFVLWDDRNSKVALVL